MVFYLPQCVDHSAVIIETWAFRLADWLACCRRESRRMAGYGSDGVQPKRKPLSVYGMSDGKFWTFWKVVTVLLSYYHTIIGAVRITILLDSGCAAAKSLSGIFLKLYTPKPRFLCMFIQQIFPNKNWNTSCANFIFYMDLQLLSTHTWCLIGCNSHVLIWYYKYNQIRYWTPVGDIGASQKISTPSVF